MLSKKAEITQSLTLVRALTKSIRMIAPQAGDVFSPINRAAHEIDDEIAAIERLLATVNLLNIAPDDDDA